MKPFDAFRLGFLCRCAEEGLRGEALDERINAAGNIAKHAGADGLLSAVTAPATFAFKTAPVSALLTGLTLGPAIGATAGLMSAPDDPSKIRRPPFLQDIQSAELAATYRQQAAELRRLTERARAAKTPARTPFGI